MECAAKGRGSRCVGRAVRRCPGCSAIAYCSLSHKTLHWSDHKQECERLKEQMRDADILNRFPFTYCEEATLQIIDRKESRCTFLSRRGLHQIGMWSCECSCGIPCTSHNIPGLINYWNLSSTLAPCGGITFCLCLEYSYECSSIQTLLGQDPTSQLSKQLTCWKEYYEWRSISLDSSAALLLHWPLTIYHALQLNASRVWSGEDSKDINIHYIGPDKELFQLAVFGELHALFPQYNLHIDFIGPEVPECRDGEKISLDSYVLCDNRDCECKVASKTSNTVVTLRLLKGFYHDRFGDLMKDSFPHLIIAPNAGIAAYPSWMDTVELIGLLNIPAVFTDFCEEAANMAAHCLSSKTGSQLALPVQLNPFRQPMAIEDAALYLPCYSNCFLFGL